MGRKAIDIKGNVYGRLTVLKKATLDKDRRRNSGSRWHCDCECGNKTISDSYDLRKGITKSCGCLAEIKRVKSVTTHKKSNTKLFGVWTGMLSRCYNPKETHVSKYYRDKNITVCGDWRNDFMSFYEWAIENCYREGLSLDRIDGNGNYEPGNCRWADSFLQNSNKSNNVFIEINGVTKTVSQWARQSGINRATIDSRRRAGKQGEELIEKVK